MTQTQQQMAALDKVRDDLYAAHFGINELLAGHDPATVGWSDLYTIMQTIGAAITGAVAYQKRHGEHE